VFDPADRLIVATALAGHRLMTADQRILGWPGRMSRLDAAK
jgi:PIN domain nuclease of toxin-antitoxin system